MASDTTSGNMSAGIMSKQDLDDYLKEFDDSYETVITTIPRDGSLTIDEFKKQHEALANEFSDRLIEVANKASKLKALVSFVNTTANDGRTSETGFDEYESETEEENDIKHFPVKKKANILLSCTSSDIDENDEINACVEDEDALSKLLILKNDIKWLTVPFLAVERDNIEVVEMCYKTGIDLEIFRNLKGQTLLNHSIVQSKLNFDIINVLLKCIGVNIGAKHGKTPVMTCIQNSKITVKERFALLKRLIDAGADVMNRSFYPGTILHDFINSLAMEMNVEKLNEWKSVIDLLLRKGVDINATDFVGQTALVCAITTVPPTGLEDSDAYDLEAKRNLVSARRCKVEIVEYLMHKGANMEVIGNNEYTALCMALANQNVDVVETLVKHGANVNHLTNIKMSSAHVLCCEGDWSEGNDIETILLPSLRILLNAGLNLNIKGLDDSTVLHFASAKMNHSICEFLVKSGADLGAIDYLKRTPLHMAVRNIDIMVLKTPLTHACLHGNTNAVRILVENGADCKACGDLGIQPIHIAAEGGDCSMMAILENAGCDLSTRDASGSTPLHYAASDGNPDTVQYLLSHNVNKNCEDSQGLVPLDLALLRGEYRASTFLADCPSAVKFGRLPPGIFPNRPLRQMHELYDYLDEITEQLKSIGETGVDIAKAILDTPGLGKLHLDKGESKQIYESIQQLCMEIVERIGELDPLFQCKLMNAGSSFEGVKVAYPNEFDFVCHLEKLSAFVEKLENVDIPEYCQIIMKDSLTADISRFCLRSKKSLNAGAVLRHFVRLTRIATYDVLKRPHQHLFSGTLLLNESAAVFGDTPIPYSKLQGFTVSWRGPTYKHIDVSIDINPVLYTTEWPSEAVGSSILLPNIKEEGMYLIPKYCSKHYMPVVVETITLDSDLWRYSTHHVEAIMMQRLPQKARDCYILCKAFRLEPLTCSIQVNTTEGWMSETGLQKLCPLDERGNVISCEDDGSCDDYSEDDYDVDDDDGEIQGEEKRNAAKDNLRTENVHSNNFKADEGRDLDRSEHELAVRTLHDSSCLTDTDDGIVKVLVGYDNAEDTYELTAEKCIPSYHLKSLFLQEAETILSASGTFSDIHLQTIPYKVYDRLKTAVDSQYLTTLFFPSQNIYRQPQDDDNLHASIKLRMSYIDTILRLLRELGFGFQC
ncbi:hypothetical protein ACJMK2_002545 [Sinanodonta woodiana]|uniref:Mab-21-like nucleotidyltransferase domain-containing protein n=1 Tax=Sinanodonta woodiana TaxID=1069815 RepID=A0ABD3XYT0_SINWO